MSPNLEAFSKLGGFGNGGSRQRETLSFQVPAYNSFFHQQAQFPGIEHAFLPTQILTKPASSFRVGSQFKLRCWARHQSPNCTLTTLHGYMERVFNKFWGESVTHFFNVIHLLFQLISWPAINHHFSLMVVVSSVHNTIHHPMRELPWRHPIWHMVELLKIKKKNLKNQ